MSDMPLVDLERELVQAASRRAERRRRTPSRRTMLLAATVGTVLVALPAWATGVFRDAFPTAHHPVPGVGRAYVVATGTTDRGERWRFELTRGVHFRTNPDTERSQPCFVLAVGSGDHGRGVCAGGGPRGTTGADRSIGVVMGISARDRRDLFETVVPLRVTTVGFRFASGREVRVRPLVPDQARARRTGVPFAGGYVAVAYRHSDELTGLVLLDAQGRQVRADTSVAPPFTPSPSSRMVQSPAF
ncbi:MAG: hypothetical protein QOJ57_2197 [Thermoleophilaceae bacterium]|nr:hypothetical protein [Thermoleophilaceae bacterium]